MHHNDANRPINIESIIFQYLIFLKAVVIDPFNTINWTINTTVSAIKVPIAAPDACIKELIKHLE